MRPIPSVGKSIVSRRSFWRLAAPRFLQLAHPWVATAIAEHSRTLNDPIGSLSPDFSRDVHHGLRLPRSGFSRIASPAPPPSDHSRHASCRQPLASRKEHPTKPTKLSALCWVYATLIDSALLAYELVLPPLRDAEREQYYAESRFTAALFGIPREYLPSDWAGFCLYMNSALQSDMLGVSAATREMAQRLQNGAGLRVRPPFWYRALTTDLLPPRLREELHFDYGERERISAARALRWLRPIYPRLPASLRFVGPYNEVQARLRGCAQPRWTIRQSNQLWIGQPSLLTAPEQS